MSGKFIVKKITDLNNVEVNSELPESDYSTLTSDGRFVQLTYVEDNTDHIPFRVSPGIYTIMKSMIGFHLEKTTFTSDSILEEFINTKEIEDKADCFFRNVHKYKDLGFDVATRKMLIYGPPGSGKSTAIAKVANKYNNLGKTAVVIFQTEKFEAYEVKDFIKTFDYDDVERLILIMEDVGGVEMEEVRRAADAGLLSLLDNNEKTLKISTLVIATTNFPEVLMGSLTNRPGRFDDKIRASYPKKESRIKLMAFFAKRELSQIEQDIVGSKSGDNLSPAHLKEAHVRSVIHEKSLDNTLKELIKEIAEHDKAFKEHTGGISLRSRD